MFHEYILTTVVSTSPFYQGQLKVRIETETKQEIQRRIIADRYELIWSYVLEFENSQNHFGDKRQSIADWKEIAAAYCVENGFITEKAQKLSRLGLKKMNVYTQCARIYGM
jgi:hypothetical protein